MTEEERIREAVRARYAAAAVAAGQGGSAETFLDGAEPGAGDCCGTDCCAAGACTTASVASVSAAIYSAEETSGLPAGAVRASLGCGNPTALIDLHPGEVVLDLGSGGGIDVLLSARRVGPTGFACGVDMTDEMLALAERNAAEQGATNVRFVKGSIEEVPLPDAAVDVVISNCVINLSADKGRVLREAFRVLRPGGRFAVSDVVVQGSLPEEVRRDIEQWAGCVAGALEEGEYRGLLTAAGFDDVEVVVTREYSPDDLPSRGADGRVGIACDLASRPGTGRVVSAFVRARKPVAG